MKTRAIIAAAALLALAFAPAAQASPSWQDGLFQQSSITNCVSIIQGTPYQEIGSEAYTGQYADPNALPGVGDTFYTHVVVVALGNACSGQRAHIEITPPSGVSLAITAGTPVFCYALNFNVSPATASPDTADCPQSPQGTVYGYGSSFDAVNPSQTWPLPQGEGWELQIPVTSNRVLNGGFGACADCMGYAVKMFDGNSSPVLQPHQGLFVQAASTGGGGLPGGSGGAPPPAPTGTGTTTPPASAPVTSSATPTPAPAGKKCKRKHRAAAAKKCKKKR
jgi:hypothetical protein